MLRPGARGLLVCCGLAASMVLAESGAVWIDVPFVKQGKNGCGAASIAMLMRYWSHKEADLHRIQRALDSPGTRGARGADVERYLDENGYRTFVFEGEWRDLEQHLAKGRPLMVCLRPGRASPLHYVVVAGVDPAQNLVLVNDPAQRKLLKVERGMFEKDWSATDHWTLLAVPQQGR